MRFGTTGVLATAVHVVVAVSFISQFGVRPYIANPIAFLIATSFSYAINTLWSFSSRMSHRTLWRYATVSVVVCVATMAIAAAAEQARWDYRIGIMLVIVLVTPTTFTLHSLWTYRQMR
jgi:putative flippase GtrA